MKKHLILSFLMITMVLILSAGVSFAGRNLSVSEYELVSFSPPDSGVTLLYPKGWEVKKVEVEKGILFKAVSPNDYLYEVYKDKANPEETLDDYTESQGEWLSENYENYKELEVEKAKTIGNFTGNLRKYSYTYKEETYEVVEFYFEDKNDNFYIILLDVPEGELESSLPLFEKLIEGIKITQPVFSFKEFTSPESDFMLKYPAEWSLYPSKKDMVFEVGDGKGVYVQVLVHKLSSGMDTKRYAESSGKWLRENLNEYEETSFKPYLGNDELKGYVRAYTYTGDNGKRNYVLEYYFTYKLEDKNKGFTLIFVMPEDLDSEYVKTLRRLQKEILDSFSLIYG